jgi:hypothetical protein
MTSFSGEFSAFSWQSRVFSDSSEQILLNLPLRSLVKSIACFALGVKIAKEFVGVEIMPAIQA